MVHIQRLHHHRARVQALQPRNRRVDIKRHVRQRELPNRRLRVRVRRAAQDERCARRGRGVREEGRERGILTGERRERHVREAEVDDAEILSDLPDDIDVSSEPFDDPDIYSTLVLMS